MKVLTLNVHAWIEEEAYEKLEILAKVIKQRDYDIIALQEVNQSITGKVCSHPTYYHPRDDIHDVFIKEDNYALKLVDYLNELGCKYFWTWTASHIGYQRFDEGVAILSKEPISLSYGLLVSDEDSYESYLTRKTLIAKTTVRDEAITVVNVHLSWWKDYLNVHAFKHEWDRLNECLQNYTEERLVVLGDFNNDAEIRDEGYDYILYHSPFLEDTFVKAKNKTGEYTIERSIDGWAENKEGKRIDYIFVNQEMIVRTHRVLFDGIFTPVISDHYAIEAEIEL